MGGGNVAPMPDTKWYAHHIHLDCCHAQRGNVFIWRVDRNAFEQWNRHGWTSRATSLRLASAVCDYTVNLWCLGPPEALRAVYASESYSKTTRKPSLGFLIELDEERCTFAAD